MTASRDKGPRASFRKALAHREFRLVAAGLAVSGGGNWLYQVALLVYVFEQTHSASWVAAASILRLLPALLLSPVGGAIADRYERRTVMIASDTVRGVLQIGLAAVAWLSGAPAIAIALALLTTTAGTPFRPAAGAMTPVLVGEEDLAAANAVLVTIDNLALILGPAVGGLLLGFTSAGFAFAFNGFSFFVSALAVLLVRTRSFPGAEERRAGLLHTITEGARALRTSTGGTILVGFFAASTLIYGAETVLLVLVSERLLGTGSQGLGYLLAAVGVGSVVCGGIGSRLVAYPRPQIPLAVGLVGMGVPLAFLPLVHNLGVALALMTLQGAGVVIVDVLVPTLLQRTVPQKVLGRVLGITTSVVVASTLAGSLVAPALVSGLGLTGALLVVGIGVPALAVAALPSLRGLAEVSGQRRRLVEARLRILEGLSIFEGASAPALELLAASAREEHVPQGATVIREGEPAVDFFVVVQGSLEVLASRADSEVPASVNTLGPGDYFGEIGLLTGRPRTATVVATTDCELLRISGQDFLGVLSGSPGLTGMLLDGAVSRLARTDPGGRMSPSPEEVVA
jgi:MFS family permease